MSAGSTHLRVLHAVRHIKRLRLGADLARLKVCAPSASEASVLAEHAGLLAGARAAACERVVAGGAHFENFVCVGRGRGVGRLFFGVLLGMVRRKGARAHRETSDCGFGGLKWW